MSTVAFIMCVFGVIAIIEPLVFTYVERWYAKHPEEEKTNYYEVQFAVFRLKYAKAAYIAAGIALITAGVILWTMFA